jgi:SAM-dependent methyltransferase
MRREEAARMAEWIDDLSLAADAVCLNIGSSTGDFRTRGQPHIDQLLFAPMRQAGIRVFHCDLKDAPGVDLVGDVLDPAYQKKLRALGAQLLICSNLLEHLTDPLAFAAACGSFVSPGGYALITVPADYPFHPDPIDTLFRPTPEELAAIFPEWTVVKAEQMACGNFWEDLKLGGGLLRNSVRYLLRLATPFYRPRFWLAYVHRLPWLFRDYRVSLLLVRKPASSEG